MWQLPPTGCIPTIFKGEAGIPRDDEAFAIWTTLVPAERITELGLAENFWQMGDTGPCGRCSEIHYFRGNDMPCDEERGPACRGHRLQLRSLRRDLEQRVHGVRPAGRRHAQAAAGAVDRHRHGPRADHRGDPGQALELRHRPVHADPRRDRRARRASTYRATLDDPADVSMRVIADHLRAMTFLIADGVLPSNEWRGYVLRKIMRRAMRHGKKLGFTEPFLHALVDVVVARDGRRLSRSCTANRDAIVRVVRSEEERFDAVLTAGLPRLEESLDRAAASGSRSCRATRRSGSTTRSACRSTSWRISPASAGSRSTARATSARWKASA